MGVYGDRIKAQHEQAHLSAADIRGKKIARCKARGEVRRAERRAKAEAMHAKWQSHNPVQQMIQLDLRLGIGKGAEKQRARLLPLLQKNVQETLGVATRARAG